MRQTENSAMLVVELDFYCCSSTEGVAVTTYLQMRDPSNLLESFRTSFVIQVIVRSITTECLPAPEGSSPLALAVRRLMLWSAVDFVCLDCSVGIFPVSVAIFAALFAFSRVRTLRMCSIVYIYGLWSGGVKCKEEESEINFTAITSVLHALITTKAIPT
jgi:hypothetical protein